MLTKREIIFVSIAIVAILGVLVFYTQDWLRPIGLRLENPKIRVLTLSKLIKRNSIEDLPKHFSYRNEEDIIQYYTAKDKNGNEYHLVAVTYDIALLGNRTHSFVFNSDGKCLIHSQDSPRFDNGSMMDLTQDGYIEKILTYNIAESDGHIDQTVDSNSKALQVWRLQSTSPELLLDIRHKRYIDFDGVYYSRPIRAESLRSQQIELVTLSPSRETLVTFSWSQEKEEFICDGPIKSDVWAVLFPIKMENETNK